MKIAIFEPDPRVCGPLSWAGHLKRGFLALGHDCDLVSATKSGRMPSHWGNVKPGGKWWSTQPDRVTRMDQLHYMLDEYDFIMLPEPKSPLADKLAKKADDGSIPWYVQALEKTSTRFGTALHGNPYTESNSPFAGYILALPNFCGTIIDHWAPLRKSSLEIEAVPSIELPLPYTARTPIDAPFTRSMTAGTTGRFMFNKGSHVTGLATMFLPPEAIVEVWGSCSTGRGPSLTWNLYEVLKPMSEPGKSKRYHNSDPNHPKATEDGNIVQPFPFDVRVKDHALCRYLGNYIDPIATASRFMVHVNLTSGKYTSGMEYSTLEAMDAGALCITPPHCSDPVNYRTLVLNDWFAPPGSVTSAMKNPGEIQKVADAIMKAFGFLDLPIETHRGLVQHNRNAIRRMADPAAVANGILQACL